MPSPRLAQNSRRIRVEFARSRFKRRRKRRARRTKADKGPHARELARTRFVRRRRRRRREHVQHTLFPQNSKKSRVTENEDGAGGGPFVPSNDRGTSQRVGTTLRSHRVACESFVPFIYACVRGSVPFFLEKKFTKSEERLAQRGSAGIAARLGESRR